MRSARATEGRAESRSAAALGLVVEPHANRGLEVPLGDPPDGPRPVPERDRSESVTRYQPPGFRSTPTWSPRVRCPSEA
ncbi:hypothetical protein BN2537_17179 [Streptomyces venezuelae]|nr:hypothetical protein BN2537_17179 [Streptomyces venezuelae]